MNSILKRRRALMAQQGGSTPRLPAEYQEVEFIESISASYIKTDITPKSNTPKIKLRYYKATQATAENTLFFVQSSVGSTGIEIGFNNTANRLFAFSSSSAQIISPIVYGHVVDVDVQLNSVSPYITMTASSGGTTETGSKTGANASGVTNGYISLFAGRNGNLFVYARMYSCEVWDDGSLTAQFIPCYCKADGVVGMYESVSGEFYSSATTNPFAKGADV